MESEEGSGSCSVVACCGGGSKVFDLLAHCNVVFNGNDL